jgi:predicted helicase
LFGTRKFKYDFLDSNSLPGIKWKPITPRNPGYFFKEFDFEKNEIYIQNISLKDLFKVSGTGIKFRKDNLLVKNHFNEKSVLDMLEDMYFLSNSEIHSKYEFSDTNDWKLAEKKSLFQRKRSDIRKVQYRIFDTRFTYYPFERINEIIVRGDSRRDLMSNLKFDNIAIITTKQQSSFDFQHAFVSKDFVDMCTISAQSKESTNVFPLYLYPESSAQLQIGDSPRRQPNLNMEIVKQIAEGLGMDFLPEKEEDANVCMAESGEVSPSYRNSFAPIDLLDYIYAVLHSPTYREKYKEFLKIDFPRVPYPKDKEVFWNLVSLGGALRQIHLLESPIVSQYITQYPVDGNNVVDKLRFEVCDNKDLTVRRGGLSGLNRKVNQGRVYINPTQYFDHVPETAWNFYIGGYQPAQKWLKDRKGRTLNFEDILHYQKIIVALMETDRLMKEVDGVLEVS